MSTFEPHGIPHLPLWGRYRVPWFVSIWEDGKPEFRVIEAQRFARAIRERLCWICGTPLGTIKAFAVGPMCTVNRVSAEPPQHKACAIYAAEHCPFLTDPDRVRRSGGLAAEAESDPTMIARNPGVTAIWVARSFALEDARWAGRSLPLVRMGEPSEVLWYCRGRPATRAEVIAAWEAGCPTLERIAEAEGEQAVAHLREAQRRALRFHPAEAAP